MIQTYKIEGMTCDGCVAKVKSALEKISHIQEAKVQLEFPQVEIKTTKLLNLKTLQNAIGKYKISAIKLSSNTSIELDLPKKTIAAYRPLILIIGFIIGITLLSQYPFENFSGMLWMRHFMAGFFFGVLHFFKLLNIDGFAK